jgi:hypothetical protein
MKLFYTPAYNSDSGQGSDQSLTDRLNSSAESAINELEVLVREHVQNSRDAFDKRENKPEKLIFKVSRKKVDLGFANLDDLKKVIDECIDYKKIQIDEQYRKNDTPYLKLVDTSKKIESRIDDNLWATVIEDNGVGLSGNTRFPKHNEVKPGTTVILDEGNSNKYDVKSGGAFGVGKLTAFSKNDLYTVFYISSFKNKIKAIGKTKLESFIDKKDRSCSPNTFFGLIKDDKRGLPASDWFTPNDEIAKIRSIKDDGLTTIIPSLEVPDDKEWQQKVSYSIIHSYFKLFERNEISVSVFDELEGTKINIDQSNYKQIYKDCESLKYLNEVDNLIDKYNYELIKPFVMGKESYDYQSFEKEIIVTKGYNGIARLHVYHNPKLFDLVDQFKGKGVKQTFRFVRRGMLLRSELIPRSAVFDPSYCGYVEFLEGANNSLNEILRSGETQSHDKLEKATFERIKVVGFPSYTTLNINFFGALGKWIRGIVEELSSLSSKDGDRKELELDFMGSFRAQNHVPSFERHVVKKELLEKYRELNKNGRISEKPLTKNTELIDDQIEENISGEKGIIIQQGTTLPAKNKEGVGEKGGAKQGDKSNSVRVNKGSSDGKRNEQLQKITYFSKIISKNDRLHEYAIKICDVDDTVNIEIKQDSKQKSSILSFDAKSIKINGEDIINFERVKNKDGHLQSLKIDDVSPKGNIILIRLEVLEPSRTESRFNLVLS